jgi:exodeoxyribonuclease VII large subunit
MARKILSVSQLTENIRQIIEDSFSMVWISGETSNLRIPSSGHAYFTLKDNKAQISAVMFRGQLRQLKFDLVDGMSLIGLGRVSVYAPKGNYQIILEYAEPQGIGALQVAFEQLKLKLEDEGLFLAQHKQVLPQLPKKIGVITSPSGSVIQDILKVLKRRFNTLAIDIYPVRVQGVESASEIVKAIAFANQLMRNDVLMIARGGGSLEDLSPFNNEDVARAIFQSKIPIISAIGHETDYTISDFVADLRAPTPSAAAELTVPVKDDLYDRIIDLKQRCERNIVNKYTKLRQQHRQFNKRLVHPGKRVQDMQLHIDNLAGRLERALKVFMQERLGCYNVLKDRLMTKNPATYINIYKSRVELILLKILQVTQNRMASMSERYKTAEAVLSAVNPAAILNRGYSITRSIPDRKVLTDTQHIKPGQLLEVQLAKGKVDVSVVRQNVRTRNNEEKTNG